MDVRRKPTASENGNRVFKGSALVSALLYTSPRKFKCRASAFKFARRLFRLGFIRSIFGWTTFEDSSHLYRWEDENVPPRSSSHSAMMSYPHQTPFHKSSLDGHHYGEGLDNAFLNDVKGRLLTESDKPGGYLIDSFFRDLERNFPEDCRKPSQKLQSQYWQNKRASTTSTDSSADPYSLYKSRDRLYPKSVQPASMASSREHSAIPEESPDTYMLGRLRSMQMPPLEYEMSNTPATYTSHASSGGESAIGADGSNRRFADQNFSYSDNEKQLLEEMKRMKKEHQHILRSYEDRINKLMTKMHELRSIAEMLESSSTKSSPYGVIPAKGGALGSLEARLDQDRSWTGSNQNDSDVPPPLPPRPGRGTKVYPNKPILQPRRKMKYIPWKRIILSDLGTPGSQLSVWHTMVEPRVDTEALESQFNDESDASRKQLSLYEDVVARRGRSRNQVSVVDRDKAQIFVSKIHFLKLTLQDVLQAISNLHTTFLDEEGSDSLLDLVLSHKDMDRVLHHVKKKGVGHLDITDFIMFEVSRVDHFRAKAELLRFQQRIHDYLFDIDQQLKDVRTACEEICSSVFLKNLLETLLAVGNHMNGGTAEGQADGYHLHILANLKATENKDGLGNLLEFLVRLYCELYTQDNCRFCLPEPSNMRHAAQVSLTDINKALEGLGDDLCHVRKNISPLFHSSNGPLSEAISGRLQQFFVKAEESIEAQRKHYRETKDNFQRTAAYFMFGGENEEFCTKTFFGTWATFLHDCKHYWKDIQRKLAKERFQAGFVIAPDKKVPACKPPLSDPPPEIPPKPSATVSSSSLQNHSSPKKHESEAYPRSRDPWEIPETAGTLSRQRDSHHAKTGSDRQHRLGPGPEVKSPPSRHKTYKDTGSNRSSSPKRIISTPPTGDIHRPVPTPPKPSKLFSNIPQGGRQSNYENQEAQQIQQHHSVATQSKDHSPSRPTANAPPSPKRAQIPVPELEDPHRKQSNGFSLKSWLRKESGKPKQGNQEQMLSPKETDQQSKSNTAFVKLRNTVVQKFGNPSPSRRPIDSSPVKENRDPRHHSPSKYNPGQRDSSSGRSRSRSRSPSTERGHPRHGGHVDSDAEAEEEVAFYNGRSSKPREKSPSKQSDMKTGPPTTAPKPQTDVNPNFQPFGIIDPNTGTFRPTGQGKSESDMNNNDAGTNPVAQSKRSRGRDRAPLALGSNISLSDPYPRPEQDPKQSAQRQSWDVNPQSHATTNKAHRHYNTIAGTSPVNPIPTYRAKVIHMYENQCKYDAGDVNANVQHIRGSQDHFHQAQKYNTIGQGRSSNYFLMHSKDGEQGRHGNPRRDPGEEYYPDQRRHRQGHSRPTPERDVHSKGASYQQSQLNPRDKAAAHAQSITSLIDRFEAGKGPPPPNFAENPVAMTSTPVTQRKNVPLTLPADSHGKDEQNSHRYPQHNQVQNPFPLLDGVSQAATSSGNVQAELHRRSDAGGDGVRHHVDMSRAGHHSYPPQPSSHRSYDSRRPEHDEGYRDQLRRAFNNNNNVTPRYPKANMGFAGQAQTFQRSPPQIMRAVPVKQSAYHHGGVTV